jgi:NAD(P)H dehydrogenase (quinone)
MIVVMGATGKLGRHVLEALLARLPACAVAARVRDPAEALPLAVRGVQVLAVDYDEPGSLTGAFCASDKVLLIPSRRLGTRPAQHAAVVTAARRAGVRLLAYASLLHADSSGLEVAREHRETEALIRESGLPSVFLRNGACLEHYTGQLASALADGTLHGCSMEGRVAAATRADYAAAAVRVMTGGGHVGKVYELAGDSAFSGRDLAARISELVGTRVDYRDWPAQRYREILLERGMPEPLAEVCVDSDLAASRGELDDTCGQLRVLIGRPTTRLTESLAAAFGELRAGPTAACRA